MATQKNKKIVVHTKNEDVVIHIPRIQESLAKDMEADPMGYIANITLDVYTAKSLAHTILSKVANIERSELYCECGRRKCPSFCSICDDDS